jgi:hypothetical protein
MSIDTSAGKDISGMDKFGSVIDSLDLKQQLFLFWLTPQILASSNRRNFISSQF